MNRPPGVTASAILAIVGSILALLFAAFGIASLFVETPRPQPPNTGPVVIAGALMMAGFAVAGIGTGIGVFRLRPWARRSILIFAGFLAAGCIFALLATMTVPVPPDISTDASQLRLIAAIMFGAPIAIAVWWLIQFNTQSTKAAFASSVAEPASPRPISITVIAWMTIVGGASTLVGIFARSPAFLFGAIFQGWAAGIIYAVFGALTLYIGKGLLELQEEARILGIGWFAFSLVHTGLMALMPSLRQRMFEMQQALAPQDPRVNLADLGMMPIVMLGMGLIVSVASIWFLIRHRAAFGHLEKP